MSMAADTSIDLNLLLGGQLVIVGIGQCAMALLVVRLPTLMRAWLLATGSSATAIGASLAFGFFRIF